MIHLLGFEAKGSETKIEVEVTTNKIIFSMTIKVDASGKMKFNQNIISSKVLQLHDLRFGLEKIISILDAGELTFLQSFIKPQIESDYIFELAKLFKDNQNNLSALTRSYYQFVINLLKPIIENSILNLEDLKDLTDENLIKLAGFFNKTGYKIDKNDFNPFTFTPVDQLVLRNIEKERALKISFKYQAFVNNKFFTFTRELVFKGTTLNKSATQVKVIPSGDVCETITILKQGNGSIPEGFEGYKDVFE